MDRIGKIIFYEDRNFLGRSYECSADCPELSSHFGRCNSIQVQAGSWVLYERPNYLGPQYILARGEYPDYQRWMGYNDNIRSCRMIQNTSGTFRVRIYERPDFIGQMMEYKEDATNLSEHWRHREVQSANVLDGAWVFYEQPNYRGQQFLLERGEYRRSADWGAVHANVGSFRHVQDL